MQFKYKLNNDQPSSLGTFGVLLLFIILIIILFVIIFRWNKSTQLPSYCNKGGCNCCNMPREANILATQPDGWNCVDCPDGNIITHASRGWITLDIKGIESKIKEYNIDIDSYKNIKCLVDYMKSKKLNDCMRTLWPSIDSPPKHLCWRSWRYQDQQPNIFEYTPCEHQSNFNILIPNSNSIEVDEFSKWWHSK